MKILIIHHPKGAILSCLIIYLLSVANFEGHIMKNDLLDVVISDPWIIGIHVKILILHGDHNIYRCARVRIRLNWSVESKYLTFVCLWYAIFEGGVECRLDKKRFKNEIGIFLVYPTQNLCYLSKILNQIVAQTITTL